MSDASADFRNERQSIFYAKADGARSHAFSPKQPAVEPVLSREQVAHLCELSLGGIVLHVTPLTQEGTYHQLWRVGLIGGRSVILRASARPELGRDYPLLLDAVIGRELRAKNIPAVKVREVDLSRRHCGTDYAILSEAKGMTLSGWEGDETRMQFLLDRLGTFLARIHQISCTGYGLLDPMKPLQGLHARWQDYLRVNLEQHIEICTAIKAVGARQADRIREVFAVHLSSFASIPSVLLHGDPGNHNVFATDDITCLIDWEDALAGDPVYDIAFWATFHPQRRHAGFLAGYRTVADLPDDFEFRFRLYFLRIALAKTVVRHRLGLRDLPGREPASQRIVNSLEQMEQLTQMSAA